LTWLSSVPQNGHRIPCLSCANGQLPAHSEHRKPCAAWPPDGRNTDITTPFAAVPRPTVPPGRRRNTRVLVRNLRYMRRRALTDSTISESARAILAMPGAEIDRRGLPVAAVE
jgi:hypothetical protein